MRSFYVLRLAFCTRSRSEPTCRIGRRGQFVPITAMVMFTLVVFMVAVLNVYKVTSAKLKAQNLADAVALNLASQEAQAYNTVSDRNEWMNYMEAGIAMPTAVSPGTPTLPVAGNPCAAVVLPWVIPGISCAGNKGPTGNISNMSDSDKALLMKWHVFHDLDYGVKGYASLVQAVNAAQTLFVQAYNTFLGASNGSGGSGNTSGGSSMKDLLMSDIPELNTDPTIHMVTYNTTAGEQTADGQVKNWMNAHSGPAVPGASADIQTQMQPLNFAIKDIEVRYYDKSCLVGDAGCVNNNVSMPTTLGASVAGPSAFGPPDAVGYMVPANVAAADQSGAHYTYTGPPNSLPPQLYVTGDNGSTKQRTGVGVSIVKDVDLPILGRTVNVVAKSKAYIVSGSGKTGEVDPQSNIPTFQPTYWVKLAN